MVLKEKGAFGFIAVIVTGIVVLFIITSSPTYATEVRFAFVGVVVQPSPLDLPAPVGTPFSGTYSIEATTPDLAPSDIRNGTYALRSLSFTILGNTYSALGQALDQSGNQVLIDMPSSLDDLYSVGTNANDLSGPLINGLQPGPFFMGITGPHLFTDDSLPLTPPSLGNLTSNRVFFSFFDPSIDSGGQVQGRLTSLTLAPVPLPGTLLLFGSGLIGLIGIKARRRFRRSE